MEFISKFFSLLRRGPLAPENFLRMIPLSWPFIVQRLRIYHFATFFGMSYFLSFALHPFLTPYVFRKFKRRQAARNKQISQSVNNFTLNYKFQTVDGKIISLSGENAQTNSQFLIIINKVKSLETEEGEPQGKSYQAELSRNLNSIADQFQQISNYDYRAYIILDELPSNNSVFRDERLQFVRKVRDEERQTSMGLRPDTLYVVHAESGTTIFSSSASNEALPGLGRNLRLKMNKVLDARISEVVDYSKLRKQA